MATVEMIRELYEYDRWANRRLFDAVAGLPAGEAEREIGKQFSFPTLKGMLVHVLGALTIWLTRWQGTSPTAMLSPGEFRDLSALRRRWDEQDERLRAFIDGLREPDLARVIHYTNTQGQAFRLPLLPLMQHVANHSTHHRSEVATMLTMLGTAPPPTDLVVYHLVRSGQLA
jgi:uncharacterized damage-inducible protein DinB